MVNAVQKCRTDLFDNIHMQTFCSSACLFATIFYLQSLPWKYVAGTRDNLSLVTDTIEGQLLHSHICLHARSSTGDSFSLDLALSVDTDYKASFNLKMDPEPKAA